MYAFTNLKKQLPFASIHAIEIVHIAVLEPSGYVSRGLLKIVSSLVRNLTYLKSLEIQFVTLPYSITLVA